MHSRNAFDWISRVIMLVLAGMVSLSIIGAIAAIPSGIVESTIGMNQTRQPVDVGTEQQPAPPGGGSEQRPQAQPTTTVPSANATIAPAPAGEADPERWLEAITYALLALVGLSALGTLIMWRGLKERRRIADALEIISASPRT